jgi:hypothetical protein
MRDDDHHHGKAGSLFCSDLDRGIIARKIHALPIKRIAELSVY